MFADELDILSLSRWRNTCRTNYVHASSSLRRSLLTRLQHFVLRPNQFLDTLTKHGAVIGGELAMSFLLRRQPYILACLDIYTSNFDYDAMCKAILDEPAFKARIQQHTFHANTLLNAARRLVSSTLTIQLTNNLIVCVHQSYTCSPTAPISRTPCTALSNFVTAYGFGCSHPELTLARRALLADRELLYWYPTDAACLNRLLAIGFSIAVSPTAWAEYRNEINDVELRTPEECWRERFLCPNQGRYFGDKGSFVAFFDPLGGDEQECMSRNIAPFGPMLIWRMPSTFDCEDGCEYLDEVLEQGVTSIPVLFCKDPFGQLRDCMTQRNVRVNPLGQRSGRGRSRSI